MLNQNTLVSAVINCHNGSKFIHRSLKSIINQSYKNIEIIIWDNASTDETKKLISNFTDKRIKYYYDTTFRNLYDARNQALKKVNGQYVCFLDVDDYWSKKKIELQLNNIIKTNSDISFTNCIEKSEKYIINKIIPDNYILNLNENLMKKNYFIISSVMIRSKILISKNFNFNNKFNIIGDFELWSRLSLNKRIKFTKISDLLITRYIHDKNESKIKINQYVRELDRFINNNKKNKNIKFLQYQLMNMIICNFFKIKLFSFIIIFIKNFKLRYIIYILQR
tara:strand:+ start:25361 stop:26200 length:840 start_codon:yes stop_codon:yes gene_type:complete